MPVEFDIIWVMLFGTAIALFYVAVKWLAGLLVNAGGIGEPIGKAMLNIYP